MFRMDINKEDNVFFIYAEGYFSVKEGENYIQNFLRIVKEINPSEYNFILDGRYCKISTPEVAERLKMMMQIFVDTPFRKKIAIYQLNPVARKQIENLGRQVAGFESFIFVDTLQEAMSLIYEI
jgi:hypothetical protein